MDWTAMDSYLESEAECEQQLADWRDPVTMKVWNIDCAQSTRRLCEIDAHQDALFSRQHTTFIN